MVSDENIKFWEKKWQNAIDRSPLRRRLGTDGVQRWNKMAGRFAERTADQASEEKRLKSIQWFKERGILKTGIRILDIGAGPGNWALLLAETAGHVTALEPSDGMVEILKSRIAAKGVDNITIEQSTWQAVDLADKQWQGAFDLVFASMTPGVDGPENLYKMMAASRGYCYLSAFSGKGWQQWYADLWQAVFNDSLPENPGDIINPFNLLYARGYRPDLQFNFMQRKWSYTRQEAMEDFCAQIESFKPLTDELKVKIAAFVDQRCVNGTIEDQRKGCQGMMVWHIHEKLQEW